MPFAKRYVKKVVYVYFHDEGCWYRTNTDKLHPLLVPQQIGFLHAGGLCKALAISTILTITVLIPFPLPST